MRHFSAGLALLIVSLTLVSGCTSSIGRPTGAAESAVLVKGSVFGGQQPVIGASVQLYAVGTSADGAPSTALLSSPVTTNVSGNFTLPAFTCGSATEVYLIASGGNSGYGSVNPNLALMSVLGPCSGITSSSFVAVNELTTVASVAALAPYMSSPTAIGSGPSDSASLANAFQLAATYVNPATAQSPGLNVPAGMAVPTATIYTLADIIATCVNSGGGSANSSTPCGSLFMLTTPSGGTAPADTVTALLNIANNPALNTQQLYMSSPALSPFIPQLPQAPSDFSVKLLPLSGLAALSVSSNSLTFPTTAVGFTAQAMSLVLTNNNSASLSLSGFTFSGMNTSDFIETDNCAGVVAAASTCTAQITFTPGTTGARSATLMIASNAPGSPLTVALSGAGGSPSATFIMLSSKTLSWTIAGSLQDVTVENYGNTPLTIRSLKLSDTSDFTIETNGCGTYLPAQSVCTITLESLTSGYTNMYGNEVASTFNATLTIDDDASAGAQTVSLTSTDTDQITGVPIRFYPLPVGSTENATALSDATSFYVNGGYTLAITGTNASDFTISPAQCVKNAGSGTFCNLVPTFKPSGTGLRKATATVNGGPSYIRLTGTGDPAGPSVLTTYQSSTFYQGQALIGGNGVAQSTDTYKLFNNGTTTLNLSFGISGANGGDYSTSPAAGCASLAPAASCTVGINFTDSMTGVHSGTVTIHDLNSSYSQLLPITTVVSYPSLAISPYPSYLFGTTAVGSTSAAKTFTVENGNTGSLILDEAFSISQPVSGSFILTTPNSCPVSTSQPCSFGIAFTPQSAGSVQETLTVTSTTSGQQTTITVYGTGGSPAVTLSPASLTFPTRSVGTTSVPMTVTLTNTGTQPLTVSSVTIQNAVNNNYTQTNNCTTVAANNACTINVTFAPTAAGPQTASVNIMSNAASSPNTVTIMGTAQ